MLKIELLGELRIWRGTERVGGFRYEKIKALLVFLAAHKGRSLGREFVASLLWPDLSPEDGRRNLRIALSHMKSVLFEPDLFFVSKHALGINSAACQLDLEEFERAPPGLPQ
jgi:DNA-binding SARP family transcriptional activator